MLFLAEIIKLNFLKLPLNQPYDMKKCITLLCSVLFLMFAYSSAMSQGLLKKLKKQTEQKILKKTDDVIDDALFGGGNDNSNTGGNPSPSGKAWFILF